MRHLRHLCLSACLGLGLTACAEGSVQPAIGNTPGNVYAGFYRDAATRVPGLDAESQSDHPGFWPTFFLGDYQPDPNAATSAPADHQSVGTPAP